MQDIDTAFDYIPDETNTSITYMKNPVPIKIGVKPVCIERKEEVKNEELNDENEPAFMKILCH